MGYTVAGGSGMADFGGQKQGSKSPSRVVSR
eukprot:SAG11_NODE_30166_length_303_cov_1.245098_1_plen_30_part_01